MRILLNTTTTVAVIKNTRNILPDLGFLQRHSQDEQTEKSSRKRIKWNRKQERILIDSIRNKYKIKNCFFFTPL